MPELPEVETVRQTLAPVIEGMTLTDVWEKTPGVFLNQDSLTLPARAKQTLKQGDLWQVQTVSRRGKYLLILFRKAALLVHLRMTGRLLIKDCAGLLAESSVIPDQTNRLVPSAKDLKQLMPGHTHVRLFFNDPLKNKNVCLDFHDTRRFGRIWLLSLDTQGHLLNAPTGFYQLGPEPLADSFTSKKLTEQLSRRQKTPIKAALLDQSVLAGLGNIYVDESLFQARLHPARLTETLDEQAIKKLHRSIRKVLRYAVSCQGTSLRDYVDGWNQKGHFQDCLMVYGRSGQQCRICSVKIEKMKLAGRTTSFCPNCQLKT